MKRFFRILVPVLLAVMVVASIGWYLFVYDRDFTRDMLLHEARENDLHGNSRMSAWFYNLAYEYSGQDENVAIELANQYKSDGNYTKAEVTLSKAIRSGATKELYIALCKTFVEQDKLLDAVSLLSNIADPVIKVELDAMRPTAPAPDHDSGFYSQYIDIGLSTSNGAIYYTTNGEYPTVRSVPYTEPIHLKMGESKIYAISIADSGLVSPVSILGYTVGGVVEPAIFMDAAMENAVREVLQIAADKILYTNDLWEIEEFTVPESAATLEDLAKMSFLKKLTVAKRNLTSLEDFSPLTKLESLDLSNCKFPAESLSYLAALPELTELKMNDCGLSTIANLSGAPKLTYLDLSNNTIRNLEPLTDMRQLSTLHMSHNALTTLDALSPLTNLAELDVSYNSLTSLEPIASCAMLKYINAGNNQIHSASGVSDLILLTHLYLDYNSLTEVDELGGCHALTNLGISNNQIKELFPLADLTKLSVLDFSYNFVSELPEWPDGTPLHILDGSYNVVESLDPVQNMEDLNYIYMDYNKITNVDALESCYNLVQLNVYGNEIEDVSALTDHDVIVNYDPTNK